MVDAFERHRLAVIPGISLCRNAAQSHAFVQVLQGDSGRTLYSRYPVAQFHAEEKRSDLTIGPNRFTSQGVELDLKAQDWRITGGLSFSDPVVWPITWRAPGVMGWYAWAPFMQCYHGILSLDHTLHGVLNIQGEQVDLTGGRGYMEKDWGCSFPSAYIWMQSNHFEKPGTSFTASIARIPWLHRSFTGFLVGLHHDQHLYTFATYTGAVIEKLVVADNEIIFIIRSSDYRLTVHAFRALTGSLRAPAAAGMTNRIAETLSGKVLLRLQTIREGRVLLEQVGRQAGMDAAGDLQHLAV
ncbi:MAG: hypothetical protein BWY83_01155 [bacterium ADurb.Bin478]|nr:MAG: hypothetical protein BWY83_01155 [bacterium ADurb.Bin478]